MFKIRTREPGPVLVNLDLNRTLVGDPYLGTWTCTCLCTHPYSFLYSWPNISDSYGKVVYIWSKILVFKDNFPEFPGHCQVHRYT